MNIGPSSPTTRARRALALVTLLVATLLAGCHEPTDDTPGDGTTGGDGAAVMFRDHPDLGSILTDGEGMTLYIFTNDEAGESRCYDQCAGAWPPFLADEVPEGPDAIADRLSLVTRTDGTSQVAYDDRPLYYWVSDANPGDATGDGRNGVWFVVREPGSTDELNGEGPYEVTSEDVQYHGDTTGLLALPEGHDIATGIVMIHEWWGLNDNIRDMARLLATHGYAVLAVDLFNGTVAEDADAAMAAVQGLDQEAATDNMQAAAALLRERGAERVVSLGWCFGGAQSLQLALSGEDLAATVIYYGNLETDESALDAIDHPVLGIFGEADTLIPVSSVRAFERALGNLSIENDIYIYPDVGHAFANPSGESWGAAEAQDAWARTVAFLQQHAPA